MGGLRFLNETLILRERERERERELETERERENSFLLMISMHTHEFRHTRRMQTIPNKCIEIATSRHGQREEEEGEKEEE